MSLSEEGKTLFDETYSVKKCDVLLSLHCTWDVDLDFQQSYKHDYALLRNELSDERTSWEVKYTTSLFLHYLSLLSGKRPSHYQTIFAGLIRELHFMTLQKTSLLEAGPWDTIPGMFLPSKVLDLCFLTIPSPSSDIGNLISLLINTNVPATVRIRNVRTRHPDKTLTYSLKIMCTLFQNRKQNSVRWHAQFVHPTFVWTFPLNDSE